MHACTGGRLRSPLPTHSVNDCPCQAPAGTCHRVHVHEEDLPVLLREHAMHVARGRRRAAAAHQHQRQRASSMEALKERRRNAR